MNNKLITIFTPTYNRVDSLGNCYTSLVKQTSKNFIWQIVDDGSTDETEKLINSYIEQDKIQIVYYKKENGGKVSAINYSLEKTDNTVLWMCLDSDDYLFDNAVEIIERQYNHIKDLDNVCGLLTYRSTKDGKPMQGRNIPCVGNFMTQFDIRYIYNFPPEYVQVYKTDIINNYRYPIYDKEKYMPLSYVQDQIDQKFQFYIMDENIMVCEYRSDGITNNQKKLILKNPIGYREFKRQQILFAPNIIFKLKACIAFDTGCFISNSKDWFKNSPAKLITILCYPLALLDYRLRYYHYK